ncbi:MAG: sigma-70 family RNA polymerase sigma factor [Chloroflexota bacterium]
MPGNRNVSPQDEYDLLQRARSLDESALGAVFDTYYRPLYRYLYTHLGHRPTAEDLTAEVFRVFLEQVGAGRGPTEMLRAWLYRVAHNLMVDELRRRRHHEHDPLDEVLPAGGPAVSSLAQQGEQHKAVLAALRRLSPKQQAVLTLKYLQGLENVEIAQALRLTPGTVRALQFRGLRALRRHLEQDGLLGKEMDEE